MRSNKGAADRCYAPGMQFYNANVAAVPVFDINTISFNYRFAQISHKYVYTYLCIYSEHHIVPRCATHVTSSMR